MKVTSRIKARRNAARGRRDFQRAVNGASPALRDELITMAQASSHTRLR